MKTLCLLASIVLAMSYIGCVNTDPVGHITDTPVNPGYSSGITLATHSGNSDSLLKMSAPLPSNGGQSVVTGEWETKTDSLALSTVFRSSTTIGSTVEYRTYSGTTVMLEDAMVAVPSAMMYVKSSATGEPQVSAGLLTAGEWNDHSHWSDFQKFIRQYPEHFNTWRLNLQKRVMLKVIDTDEKPVPGAHIVISSDGKTVFDGQSLGDGCIAFFPLNHSCNDSVAYNVHIEDQEFGFQGNFTPVNDDDQTWVIKIDQPVSTSTPTLDLVFTVDVTGSMTDELSYIQAELIDICDKISAAGIDQLRIGFVFYRDRGDEFVTKCFPFSNDIATMKESISSVHANGGGDFPESVNLALKQTLQQLDWRKDRNCIRLCFLVADAPPHYYQDEQYTYVDALDGAVKNGIKIIPVAGSGIDKSTEYLFRHLAATTMGRYIFLTNDSGIGGAHIDPDVGAHTVETLNGLIVRTITEELKSWNSR